MFPIRDENPTVNLPIATYVLIGMNIVVWFAVQGFGSPEAMAKSFCHYALVPADLLNSVPIGTQFQVGHQWVCQITADQPVSSLFSSMYMHGSWLHIIGNMLFLWVFGDNVEDVMGPGRFFIFYTLCGLAAGLAQVAADPSSTIPMVGASGAIGGVMGAYALLFPNARIHLLVILIVYVTTVSVPAILMLGYWFIIQLASGILSFGSSGGGVAFWAHIGGFVAGLILVWVFRHPELMAAQRKLRERQPPREANRRWM